MALVQVGYVVTQTMDDAQSGRNYRELVQLVSKAQPIERLVPGGTVSDGILVDSNHMAFNRNCALILPVASLEQGIVSPFQRDPILARVTLTPLPATASTQESNTVLINQPPTLG
jgi:hypothetical protein